MLSRGVFVTVLAITAQLVYSAPATAQYKNASFGVDAGYWLITKPTVVNKDGSIITPADKRPLRLANGIRFGGDSNFKMDQDRWWFIARLNLAFLQYGASTSCSPQDQECEFDKFAKDTLGTLFGVQGQIGTRIFILTDKFRPYLQFSLSYLRLMTFSSQAGNDCSVPIVCPNDPGENEAEFLPHANVGGGAHFQPGFEIIVTRDIALHFYADMQHWFILNASDNNAVVFGFGAVFYT